jgi:hypothetical protein
MEFLQLYDNDLLNIYSQTCHKQKTKVEHDESHQTEGKIIVKINLYCTNVKNLQNYSFQIKNLN